MQQQHHQQLALPWHDLIHNEAHVNSTDAGSEEDYKSSIRDQDSSIDAQIDSSQWLEVLYDWFLSIQPETEAAGKTMTTTIKNCIRELLNDVDETIPSCITASNSHSQWKIFQSKSVLIRHLLTSFLKSHELSDVALCTPGQDTGILCHSCILSAHCEYFTALFSEKWSPIGCEEDTGQIAGATTDIGTERDESTVTDTADSNSARHAAVRKVPCDADPRHVQLLLRYFYGSDVFNPQADLSVCDAMGAYALAHFWGCAESTLDAIAGFVYSAVDGEYAVHVLTFADTYSLSRLRDKCFTLVINEMTGPVTDVPDSAGEDNGSGCVPVLSPDIQACMAVLRRACNFVKSKHNFDVECSVREVVAILKESLLEEEAVWNASVLRHQEAVRALEQEKETRGWGQSEEEYAERLRRVQVSLDNQECAMAIRRTFFEQQEQSLAQLGL